MKLKQIALAAAVVATSSTALADVTVYGVADVNVNNSKDELSAATKVLGAALSTPGFKLPATAAQILQDFDVQSKGQSRIDSSGLSTSRIGFKGSEDLGGGMKASFQLEGKINTDTGQNANYDGGFFGRQSWVGLTGSFATVQLGKTWTAFHDVKGDFEHADNTNLRVTSAVWGVFGNNYDANTANQIKYTLPLSSGLTASIGYSFGENKTASNDADNVVSLGVKYEAGPLAVGYGYQTEESNLYKATANDTGHSIKDRFNVIGASYDLGAAKLVGSWSDMKSSQNISLGDADANNAALAFNNLYGTNVTGANIKALLNNVDSKANRYQLGVAFPMGASNLYFGYADSSEKINGVKIGDANGYVFGATYSLSKRTTAYAGYSTVKATLNKNILYVGQPEASGKSTKTVAGIRHVF